MSKTEINEVEINGTVYVKKGNAQSPAIQVDGLDYVIVRTYSAGVFAGYLEKREGKEATIVNARRLWYWSGAASLSQLANEGPNKPNDCKFAVPVSKIIVTEAIEILPTTEKAQKIILDTKEWRV